METQYRITGRNIVKISINNENKFNISTIDNSSSNIDWLWIIDEDGKIEHNNKTYEVKNGNIVIKLFNSVSEDLIIINSPEWIDVILKERRKYEERMKQRELCKPCNGCCDDCDSCGECCNSVCEASC